jgi:hypothetical protein
MAPPVARIYPQLELYIGFPATEEGNYAPADFLY